MNKEFVPYSEALELKEIGFDEPCFGKWLSSAQSNWKNYELILEMGMNEEFEDNRNIYLLEGACSAPTFSQAFRWFREKHGLCIVIKPIDDKKLELGYNLTKNGLIMGGYTTYEKAELACLRKLIDIVKQKQ